MDTYEAVSVLKNVTYRPGWSFSAMAYSAMDTYQQMMVERALGEYALPRSTVLFHWVSETVDTDREFAVNGYDMPKRLEDTIPLDAADFESADDLLFAVFETLMRYELHESREFFRCKDRDMQAPFHPHKDEGEALWRSCMDRADKAN